MARKGSRKEVFCVLDNPVKHRKTRNILKFSAKDLEKVQDMFDEI